MRPLMTKREETEKLLELLMVLKDEDPRISDAYRVGYVTSGIRRILIARGIPITPQQQ